MNQTLLLYFSTDAVPQFIKKLSHSFFFLKLLNNYEQLFVNCSHGVRVCANYEQLFVNCSHGVRVCACARTWVCMFVRKMIDAVILRALFK